MTYSHFIEESYETIIQEIVENQVQMLCGKVDNNKGCIFEIPGAFMFVLHSE